MQVPVRRFLQLSVFAAIFVIVVGVSAAATVAQEADDQFGREDFKAALDRGMYDEAGTMAKARLDQAVRAGLVKELSTADLLSDLAEVQRLSGDFDIAIQNYELAIDIVESKRDMLNLALTAPLLGLGKSYLESGRPDRAIEYLDRAIHVRSVNEGPHSIEQAATLEVLADAYRSIGKSNKAADAADRLYLLYERKYTADGVEVVPALLKKGHILGDIGDWRRQRNAYNDALNVVEEQEGSASIFAVRPLLGLGHSHSREYFEKFLTARSKEEFPDKKLLDEAETFYELATEIARNTPDADWRITQDALIATADFYMMTDKQSNARVLYRAAWDLLSGTDEQLLQRAQQLEQISPLLQPSPDMTVAIPSGIDIGDSSNEFITGAIVSNFTVTRRGKLRDIGLVEINPERNDRIESEVKRALTQYIYRPRFEHGTAVETVDLLIRFEFPYPKSLPITQ